MYSVYVSMIQQIFTERFCVNICLQIVSNFIQGSLQKWERIRKKKEQSKIQMPLIFLKIGPLEISIAIVQNIEWVLISVCCADLWSQHLEYFLWCQNDVHQGSTWLLWTERSHKGPSPYCMWLEKHCDVFWARYSLTNKVVWVLALTWWTIQQLVVFWQTLMTHFFNST